MNDNTTQKNHNQEACFLTDLKTNGKERPWRDKKIYSNSLSESYGRLAKHELTLAKSIARDMKHVKLLGDEDKLVSFDEMIFRRERDAEYWTKKVCGQIYVPHVCYLRSCRTIQKNFTVRTFAKYAYVPCVVGEGNSR